MGRQSIGYMLVWYRGILACAWRVCWRIKDAGGKDKMPIEKWKMPGVCFAKYFKDTCVYVSMASCALRCALVPQTFTLIVYKYFGSEQG